jgi:thiamine-phosphate pyrophosphorylase
VSGRDDAGLRARIALIVITDPDCGTGRNLIEVVNAALAAGAPAIQLRDKNAGSRDLLDLARRLREETTRAGALLFMNDRVDVAIAAGADGAHLGDDDLPIEAARRITPPGFILGSSVDSDSEAQAAQRAGADYLGVGPIYRTYTKGDAGDAVGPERIAEISVAVDLPVIGIGGIEAANAHAVIRAGGAGVAVVSAIMRARDPAAATGELLAAMR